MDKSDLCKQYTVAQRIEELKRIISEHPGKIPVVVEKGSPESPEPIRKKFLIPGTISYGQFCHIVKKRVNLNPEEGLVIMIGDIIPVANTSMNEVYKLHKKDESGFLITTLHKEHIFG